MQADAFQWHSTEGIGLENPKAGEGAAERRAGGVVGFVS